MSLRSFIEHNYWLKLFSLLLATLIWFIIRPLALQNRNRGDEIKLVPHPGKSLVQIASSVTVTGEFARLPVFLLSSAGDPRSFRVEPAEVSVSLSGEKEVLTQLSPRDIQVVVDITDLPAARLPGQNTNAFARKVTVNTPSGVALVKVEPAAVRIDRLPSSAIAPAPVPSPSLTPSP